MDLGSDTFVAYRAMWDGWEVDHNTWDELILLSKATIPNFRPLAPPVTIEKFVWWWCVSLV